MIRTMRETLNEALSQPGTFWLNLSIFLFMLMLPFNAFTFPIGHLASVKPTKVMMLLVSATAVIAMARGNVRIKRLPWLYFFLLLQPLASLVSAVYSPHPRETFILTLAITQYSVLVYVLVNAIDSEKILRACLYILSLSCLIIVGHSLTVYVLNKGIFHTRLQDSILGNHLGHYFAYALLLTGTGLIGVIFTFKGRSSFLFYIVFFLWSTFMVLSRAKMFHISMAIFLLILLLINREKRRVTAGLIAISALAAALQFCIVPVVNGLTFAAFQVRASKAGETETIPRSDSPQMLDSTSVINGVSNRWSAPMVAGSTELRVRGIIAGYLMGMSRPLTGVGAGQSALFYDRYSEQIRLWAVEHRIPPYIPFERRIFTTQVLTSDQANVFNMFMNAWAETGMLGLASIVGILWCTFAVCARALWKKRNGLRALCLLFPLFCALVWAHQGIYMWLHPWFWTALSLTLAGADIACSYLDETL